MHQLFIRNIVFLFFVVCVLIVIGYFFFEKQAFNGILKVIGIQKYLKLEYI